MFARRRLVVVIIVGAVLSFVVVKSLSSNDQDVGTVIGSNIQTGDDKVQKSDRSHPKQPTITNRESDGARHDRETDHQDRSRDKMLPDERIIKTPTGKRSQSNISHCTPATDIVYIKVHKTGSSTLQNIFYRFGDGRDLTFALPASNFYIEGVGQLKPGSILPPPRGKQYNILANHARFFYNDFKRIMPEGTKFVTLIRQAASHFSSLYSYFVLKRQYKVDIEQFSLNPRKYFEKYNLKKQGRISGRDPELFDLGFNKEDMYNDEKVDEYIRFLDSKMDLVLLTEYFYESIILLKDLMCWDLRTIVHLNSKMRVPLKSAKTVDPNSKSAQDLKKRLNEWNLGDFKLYDHFNKTLWRKVDEYGRSRMYAEIEDLKQLCQIYENECMSGTKVRDISYWSGPIGLKEYVLKKEKAQNMTCRRLGMSEPEFVPYLRKKHKSRLKQ